MISDKKQYLTDEEYKLIYERVVRFCLDFIIVRGGEILLVKRDIEPCKGYWSLPGGVVRYKESIDQAMQRILKSEIGLKPLSKKLLGYMEFPDEVNQGGVQTHSVSLVFLTVLEEGEISGGAQAREVRFFKSLPKESLNPIQGKFLKEHWKMIMGQD